ncbi:hypothetical protein [Endozoicomonas montiporae]|uniref:Virion morphogenesis protein n=1 Tax=Endozoicomonas montiporae CL-33 TaxID=570277 RepID=A0A142BCT5_9GAMM|nr:hypothetical protein [Endozoicomonas montiporae]AMO56561.1 hypothetical protein EZMO1_2477 [Endozoicomonas montiporae CL-33]
MAASADPFQFAEDQKARLTLFEQLDVLTMPPHRQRKLVKRMATEVRNRGRQNIRQQKTVSGSPMKARKNTRNRRKMLRNMGKQMAVFPRGKAQADVTWKNTLTGRIAYQQQHGVPETMTASKMKRIHGQPNYNAPASRDMARALLAEGYRQPVKGKNGRTRLKRASQKQIMKTMTIGQAGLVLKALRDSQKKQRWTIRTPARPFLGASPDNVDQMLHQLAKESLAGLRAKGAR